MLDSLQWREEDMFDRIKALVDRWHDLREVESLTDRDLEDLGMSRAQVLHFTRMPYDVADRVAHMAAVFGLTEDELQKDYGAYLDLLDTCGGCTERGPCARILASGQASPDRCLFCPNAPAFAAAAAGSAG
jgi:hypothetical protein